jgi:hypothetical protein
MKISLTSIEARLQNMVEGGLKRLFFSGENNKSLPVSLIQAMQSGVFQDQDGLLIAPNLYYIVINPTKQDSIPNRMLEELSVFLDEFGAEAGYTFRTHPVVRIQADASISPEEIRVIAINSQANLPSTSNVAAGTVQPETALPGNPFLIVNGTDTFVLDRPVINIGRRDDNDLVLNDKRVSRLHAQLRIIRGQYSIFDLDSSSGTYVNGKKIHQFLLVPGDVISLGGVPIIYGHDLTTETGPSYPG